MIISTLTAPQNHKLSWTTQADDQKCNQNHFVSKVALSQKHSIFVVFRIVIRNPFLDVTYSGTRNITALFFLKRIQINVFNYVDNVLNWRKKTRLKCPMYKDFSVLFWAECSFFFLLFLLSLPAAVVLFVFWLLFSFHFIWLLLHVPLQFKINDNWILNNWIEHSACMVCNVCART